MHARAAGPPRVARQPGSPLAVVPAGPRGTRTGPSPVPQALRTKHGAAIELTATAAATAQRVAR